ncbi:MAG: helix-turn-helix domain-containing protein [Halobaculum sp.]
MPDESTSSDDHETESRDVNERVVAEWTDETTPFERVYEIISRTYDPASADEIAERARVSATTARKHLRALADSGAVTTTADGRTTCYHRSQTAIVTERAESILAELTADEIATGIADMKQTIREWREEYGVESPEELAREMDVADADDTTGSVLTEWQTTRRNLALAEAALATDEASETTGLGGDDTLGLIGDGDDGNGDDGDENGGDTSLPA